MCAGHDPPPRTDPGDEDIPLREVYREVEMSDEIDRRDLGEEDPRADTLAKP